MPSVPKCTANLYCICLSIDFGILKQTQYRFAVNFRTLSTATANIYEKNLYSTQFVTRQSLHETWLIKEHPPGRHVLLSHFLPISHFKRAEKLKIGDICANFFLFLPISPSFITFFRRVQRAKISWIRGGGVIFLCSLPEYAPDIVRCTLCCTNTVCTICRNVFFLLHN